ncbi:MAG: hypothetical protein ACI9F2_000465 [Lysobacterales bacterium]|jgi:hypothetical protein
MKKNILLLILLIVSVSSCGYTTKSALPGHLNTVYVEAFENKISYTSSVGRRNLYFPLLEVDVRDAVIDRYLFDGNLKITEEDNADLILQGILQSYSRTELRKDDNDDVEEYRIYVTMKLQLIDTKYQSVMWSQNITGETTYFVTGASASTEESAVEEAIEDLARRIVEKTIENW